MKKFALAALMVAALVASSNKAHAVFVIDNFNAPAGPAGQSIATTANGTVHNGASGLGSDAIGGARDLQVTRTGGLAGRSVALSVNTSPTDDFLNYAQSATADGAFAVTWDGAAAPAAQAAGGSGPVALGNYVADITEGGLNTKIQFLLLSNSSALTTFTLEIYSVGGGFSSRTDVVPIGVDVVLNWGFATLVGNADLTKVEGVRLIVDQAAGAGPLGTQLDRIAAVATPEPSSIALLGLGVLGLVGRQLRRRK